MAKKKPNITVRNPAAEANAFVASVGKHSGAQASKNSDSQASKRSDAQMLKHSDAQVPNRRVRADGRVHCTIYLPADVKRELAKRAAVTDREMSDIAAEAVCALLGLPYTPAR